MFVFVDAMVMCVVEKRREVFRLCRMKLGGFVTKRQE